jgi:hypothetical protein
MDVTLNNYIKRVDEIISNKSNTDKRKNQNEIKQMIFHMENTLLAVKEKYKKYIAVEVERPNIEFKNVNNTSLYINMPECVNLNWISELNQYSIKINNLVLRGNIGNIYDKRILLNDRIHAHQVVPCSYGNKCKAILSEKYCKYYHDPMQLLALKNSKLISEDFFTECKKYIRNFSNTSWVYTSAYSTNMRCIGSRTSLLNDMQIASVSANYQANIETMKQQVMHDILVLLLLSQNNLA